MANTDGEMIQVQKNILAGNDAENAGFHSVNEVRTVPKAFKDWVRDNQDRIVRAKALPYFLRDNGKIVDGKWVLGGNVTIEKPHYMSEEQFEKLSKNMSVTDKEKHVLYDSDDLYIDSSWSRTINSELAAAKVGRTVPDDFMDKGSLEQIRTLDAVIDKNTLPEDMWLYRKVYPQWLKRDGVDFSVGSIVHEYGFTSTSAVEGANVMRKGKDVLLEIHAPKGTNAFVSANSEESEVILPRNTKFKVVSVYETNEKRVLRLEVMKTYEQESLFAENGRVLTPQELEKKLKQAHKGHNDWFPNVHSPLEKYLPEQKYVVIDCENTCKTTTNGIVVLCKNTDARMSKYHQKCLLTHELAHVLTKKHELCSNEIVLKAYDNFRKFLGKKTVDGRTIGSYVNNSLETIMEEIMSGAYEMKGYSQKDLVLMLNKAADVIKSIDTNYGWGHTDSYFMKSRENGLHEFLSHSAECLFHDNPILKQVLGKNKYESYKRMYKKLLPIFDL